MDMEPGEFHSHNGWMFKRLDDGTVRMRHLAAFGMPDGSIEKRTITEVFDANTWCSIVSHVSRAGENHETFTAALVAHQAIG